MKSIVSWLLLICTLWSSQLPAEESSAGSNSVYGTIRVLGANGSLVEDRSNVIVFIDGLVEPMENSSNRPPVVMSHLDQQFTPHVVPIVRGMSLDFYNDDNIYHNVFSLSAANKFDLGIYAFGVSKILPFNNVGLVKLYCNIHPKMVSNVLVLNNGLFAKTNTGGAFEINDIPDGTHTVRVWHEFGEEVNQSISINGNMAQQLSFTIEQTSRISQHRNKFGQRYQEKY